MGQPGSGMNYIKSLPGFLKFLEILALLVGIGAVGYFLKQTDIDYEKKDRIEFYVAAAGVAGLATIVLFLLFIIGAHEKIGFITKLAMIVFGVLSLLLLVASSMLAHTVQYYKDNGVCDFMEFSDADGQCKHLIIGVVAGFIASALFAVDSIVHFRL